MKRLAAAILLLAVAVAVMWWTGYVFNKEMNSLEKNLNRLVDISDYASEEIIAQEAEETVRQWKKLSGTLRSIVLHNGVDELGRIISSLPQIIEHSGVEEMKTKCIEAINLIKNLKDCEKFGFDNIL